MALMLSVLTSGILQAAPAYATQETCSGTTFTELAGGWVKTDGVNALQWDIPEITGYTVTDVCYKASDSVIYPDPITDPVTSTVLNKPAGEPGSNLQNISHVSVFYTPTAPTPVTVTPPVFTAPTCDAPGTFVGTNTAQYTFARTGPDTAAVLTATAVGDVVLAAPTVFGPHDLTQLTGEQCEEDTTPVTPVITPTHQTSVCTEGTEVFTSGSVTVNAVAGLHYWLDGSEITGTVSLEPGTYEISFTTDAGFELAAGVTSPVSVTINAATALECEEETTQCPANQEWFDKNENQVVDEDECFKKVFVCKFVGTPGIDERLQTGQNPISVSVNSIPDFQGVGSFFADAQGRSLVLAFDEGQEEPDASACLTDLCPTVPGVQTDTTLCPPGRGGQVLGTTTAAPTPTPTQLPEALPVTGDNDGPLALVLAMITAYGATYFLQGRRQLRSVLES